MKTKDSKPSTGLKLNTKNTLFIGLAFFSILMLWQVYNQYCPIFLEELLKNKYGADKDRLLYIIGIIMAADNIFAIFMLPLFGSISDKTNTKWGKRMPFIVIGMVSAAIAFPFIAVMFINKNLIGVIIMMLVILIIMHMYRSPAVALMPDVTPKPLRSKANGIINFVGYLGAILAGALAMVFPIKKTLDNGSVTIKYENALIVFITASIFMVIAVVLLVLKINERKILKESEKDMAMGEEQSQTINKIEENKPLSKADKKNFFILLFAVLFWFMSFNAIETFNSLFCSRILGSDGIAGTFTIILTISSIITFIGTLNWPAKKGRKYCVIVGLVSIIFSFLAILFYLLIIGVFKEQHVTPQAWPFYFFIVYAGFGWALINANSYPMMVEMATGKNTGKFTGYYYTFSMLAQSITPVLVGLWMSFNKSGLKLLYVYAAITMIIALVIFSFFKENKKNVVVNKKGFEALDVDDD